MTILPVTSELRDTPLLRITIEPSTENRLQKLSQVMVDRAQTIPREEIGDIIGIFVVLNFSCPRTMYPESQVGEIKE
ncbi:MAG: hypothetical protein HOI42_14715 [Candidatus Marinimicrobia bacterium]|nr:hypothetical protein [Candidatus Neomarinimicrobiota bacterium]MBT6218002.1 hypothetical protein [Candidatus Neomarinimicrobiota bacterium]